MEREHQGCLIGIGMVAVCRAILFVAYKWDIPFLKCACYLLPALIGSYIGSQYFNTAEQRVKNRFSRRTWILIVIGFLILAAVLAWLFEGRLW